jgi:hypothetical protein
MNITICVAILIALLLLFVLSQSNREAFESIPIYRPKPGKPCCGKGSFCPVYVYYPYDEVTGTLL